LGSIDGTRVREKLLADPRAFDLMTIPTAIIPVC